MSAGMIIRKGLTTCAMYIGGWIYCSAILVDFEMNVGTGRTPATAHQPNNLAFLDNITHLDKQFLVMAITGGKTATVVDFCHLTVAIQQASMNNNTCRDGYYVCP